MPMPGGRAALAVAFTLLWIPAKAGYTERTRQTCFALNYDQRERAADRGDPDAVYCSAVWNAAAYVDETLSRVERQQRRSKAMERYQRAKQLGYDFNRVAMFGKTFRELIDEGDALSGGGNRSGGERQGNMVECLATIGTQCGAQCGADLVCRSACQARNTWQCNQ
jgi:hypothetical protein